jgi:hypothetical protein
MALERACLLFSHRSPLSGVPRLVIYEKLIFLKYRGGVVKIVCAALAEKIMKILLSLIYKSEQLGRGWAFVPLSALS